MIQVLNLNQLLLKLESVNVKQKKRENNVSPLIFFFL